MAYARSAFELSRWRFRCIVAAQPMQFALSIEQTVIKPKPGTHVSTVMLKIISSGRRAAFCSQLLEPTGQLIERSHDLPLGDDCSVYDFDDKQPRVESGNTCLI